MLYPVFKLNDRVKKTNWYQNQVLDADNYPTNYWYREHTERNYDIVNVGSSSALYAFDYTQFPVKAFNWALKPQAMLYGFKVLQNFFSIVRKEGVVLIPLCPFSGLTVEWAQNAYDRYYGILSSELLENYPSMARRRNYPLLANPRTSLKRLVRDVPKTNPAPKQLTTPAEYEADAEHWLTIWKNEFGIENLDAPLTEKNTKGRARRAELVEQMIAFCQERDLRPVIVLPPMHPTLAAKLSDTFRKNYIYDFVEMANKVHIPFLNYIDAADFAEDRYFANSFFMNRQGAVKFTEQVLKDCHLI